MSWLEFTTNDVSNKYEHRGMNRSVNSLIRALGNTESVKLTEEQVLSIPTVQAIEEIIGGSIAQLPIYLYKRLSDGSVEKVEDDYREVLLNREPNPFETGYNLKRTTCKNYMFYGSSRIYKEQKRNEITALYTLPADRTLIEIEYGKGFIVKNYTVNVSGDGGEMILKPEELITVIKKTDDMVNTKGALFYGAEIFNLMQKELEYQANIYKNGAMPLGILKSQNRLTKPTVDGLRTSWQNLYGGTSNAAKTVILEEGLEYEAVSLKPSELMINDTKRNNVSEVCRLFNVPESLVNSAANKYNSVEADNISFLQYTLSPIIVSIENALNKDMLLEDEKEQGYFFQFDTSEILKTTELQKYQALKMSLDSGVITINEARAKINKKPIKDDVMRWSLGSILYNPEDGTMVIPNMGIGVPNGDTATSEPPKMSSDTPKNDEKTQKTDENDEKTVKNEEKSPKIEENEEKTPKNDEKE